MKKVRAAIVGYGNIGHYVLEALQAAPDFEIAGVVRRAGAENKPEELANYAVVKDIKELGDVDVAILCTPTRSVEKYAKEYLAMGINTVDSFDIHTGIEVLSICAVRLMLWRKLIIQLLSSLPDGIREATPSYAPCSKRLLRKESLTPTSVRV